MILTAQQAKETIFEDSDDFIQVDAGDWVENGKYAYRDCIFKHEDRFYELSVSRSGSPFTDWHYCWEDEDTFDCTEVKQVEVIRKVWVAV